MRSILCLTALFCFFSSAGQMRYYVDADALGWQTGMSWEHAFRDLHDALAVAVRGDEIWVAEGTYYPATDGDRSRAFEMLGGVKLYGGFAGTETDLTERDWEAHPTILSGDIGIPDEETDNSFNLLKVFESDTATLIDGLVFRDAYLEGEESKCYLGGTWVANLSDACGGAVYVEMSSQESGGELTLRNCVFENNASPCGAGSYILGIYKSGWLTVENCLFKENVSTTGELFQDPKPPVIEPPYAELRGGSGAGLFVLGQFASGTWVELSRNSFLSNYSKYAGGGAYMRISANKSRPPKSLLLKIDSCSFVENWSTSAGGYAGGGLGLWSTSSGEVDVVNSSFVDNVAGFSLYGDEYINTFGGGISVSISGDSSSLVLSDLVMSGNVAAYGGAFYAYSKNVLLQNSLVLNNRAFAHGSVSQGTSKKFTLVNNTILENKSYARLFSFFHEGYPYTLNTYDFEAYNNVFSDNEMSSGSTMLHTIQDTFAFRNNLFSDDMDCSTLVSGDTGSFSCDSSNIFGLDPLFVYPSGGDYHPAYCSPLIDHGNPDATESLTTDLDGHPRVVNLPDIGAYESTAYSPEVEVMDVNCYGNGNGSIKVVASSFGIPPYTYLWSTGDTSAILENLEAGVYTLTVTDGNGCTQYAEIEITEPLPIEGSYTVLPASGPEEADGAIAQDSISGGTPPYFYFWNGSPGAASLAEVLPGDYTLTIVDTRGCFQELMFTVSFTSGVFETEEQAEVLLYPNPSGNATVQLRWEGIEASSPLRLSIYDLLGRCVLRQISDSGAKTLSIDVSDLPKGSYVCVLESAERVWYKGVLLLVP